MLAVIAETSEPLSDDVLYEVIDGRYVEKKTCAYATWLAMAIGGDLSQYVSERRMGEIALEMLFILDAERDLRRRPDVAFVSAEKWPVGQPPPPEGDWAVIPDLAVEVLSPREETRHSLRKINEYFQYGVQEVWLAVPEDRMVYCYADANAARILHAKDVLSTPLVPGWSLEVGKWLPVIAAMTPPKP